MAKNRVVILGLDGVPHGLVERYAREGVMPNMAGLLKDGGFRRMESSIPDVSSVAWSSAITGRNPGEHGIFGFMEVVPENYRLRFPSFSDLRCPPFWAGRKAAVINVPQTYPAKPLDGVMISGFVALDVDKATYPASLVPELRSMGYRIDVDSNKAHGAMEPFFEDLDATLEKRMECFELLWGRDEWDIFMFVFTETDRINHFLFEAYYDEAHRFNGAFKKYYSRIDGYIGEILGKLDGAPLIVHSDHGFCRLEKEFYINRWLAQNGFLRFKVEKPKSVMDMDEASLAFALDPGRVYINTKDRFPNARTSASEKARIMEDISTGLRALTEDGRPVISRVVTRDEAFRGAYREAGPDLVALSNRGFDIKGLVSSETLFSRRVFTGMHTQDDAFIITRGIESPDSGRPFHIEGIAGLVGEALK